MANTPVDLTAMVERERAKLVADKQQQTDQISAEPLAAPIRDYLSHNQDLLAWERTQDKLSTLSHIFKWISEDPGMARRLQILADRCKRHATQAEHGEFLESKREYLTILGDLVELFYKAKDSWELKEIKSMQFGGRRIYLAIDEKALQVHVPNLPEGTICFLAKEFPALILMTPSQIEDTIRVKNVFPEAVAISS